MNFHLAASTRCVPFRQQNDSYVLGGGEEADKDDISVFFYCVAETELDLQRVVLFWRPNRGCIESEFQES